MKSAAMSSMFAFDLGCGVVKRQSGLPAYFLVWASIQPGALPKKKGGLAGHTANISWILMHPFMVCAMLNGP